MKTHGLGTAFYSPSPERGGSSPVPCALFDPPLSQHSLTLGNLALTLTLCAAGGAGEKPGEQDWGWQVWGQTSESPPFT